MATSSFKSTTKRTPVGGPSKAEDSGSSNRAHRRSRSLSRFSRFLPDQTPEFGEAPAPRGKFVNTVRGSGFPEISLDDLAIEFFPSKDFAEERERETGRGRSSRRFSEISPASANNSAQRRGRSVSRQNSRIGDGKSGIYKASAGERTVSDATSRRRRSVSVVRYQVSDSESDKDHAQKSGKRVNVMSFYGGNSHTPSFQKPTISSSRRLGRSLSQKDLTKMLDGYSSQSSAVTDDEGKDGRSGEDIIEKTIQAVYAQKKADHPAGDDVNIGLYEAMRTELRYAVDEIRMELEQAMGRKSSALASGNCLQPANSNGLQTVSTVRKNYTSKIEQSEKRKQDLLAEIVLEEQRGRELSKIVQELLPEPKKSTNVDKPFRSRKNNDRNKVSKRLTKEAEKYFEDFISNVEDTDISSFDGERSDTSSITGVAKTRYVVSHPRETETYQSPAASTSLPVEMDGVVLPWLQWETSNDGSPLHSKNKSGIPLTPKHISWDGAQEANSAQDHCGYSTSSRGVGAQAWMALH
ncbi:hypothetical protein NMG60_11004588 [Bertholletia excelsa]